MGVFADNLLLVPAWQTKAELQQPESVVYSVSHDALLVSNVNGAPDDANQLGAISLVSLSGEILDSHWVKGLNAPKGMTIVGNHLYVADINELVMIDIPQKKIVQRYPAEKAKFLNDIVADEHGRVYASGFLTNSIYRLADGKFQLWVQDESLEFPNGLLVENEHLLVASWGVMTDGFATQVAGHLKQIDLKTKQIDDHGSTQPIGNLDGLELDGEGGYLVTDWMAGKLMQVSKHSEVTTLISLESGSADHTVLHDQGIVIIPMMNSGKLVAYKIKK